MKSNHSITINWTQLRHDNWNVYIAATEQGLCYVGSPDKPLTELENWVQAKFLAVNSCRTMKPCTVCAELVEYFQGNALGLKWLWIIRGPRFKWRYGMRSARSRMDKPSRIRTSPTRLESRRCSSCRSGYRR